MTLLRAVRPTQFLLVFAPTVYRENPKIGNYHTLACPYVTPYTPVGWVVSYFRVFSVVSTKFHYFKIVPPASPYIIIPPGGIIIYELAGGNILKKT